MYKFAIVTIACAALCALALAIPPDCDKVDDGFYENPDNCRKYYECSSGSLYPHICQEDWLWKASSKYCDFPVNVDCGDILVCDDKDDNCVEHHPPTQPPQIQCDDKCVEENGLFPIGECSPLYCNCAFGEGVQQSCDEDNDDLVFNSEVGNCDFKPNTPECPEYVPPGK